MKDTIVVQDTIKIISEIIKEGKLVSNDTFLISKDGTIIPAKKVREHSPQRATILSAVLPGLGQAYNRKYWKIPVIYVVGGGLYYYFDHANERFNYWKDVFKTELAKGEDGDQRIIDNASLNRDAWSKRRGYAVIFMGLLYIANVVDAMTDAHFYKFNISDDLSIKVEPSMKPAPFSANNYSYGFKLSMNF